MSSGAQPLYGARALADWIRAGGHPKRAPIGHSLRLRWHARWFELNWRTQLSRLADCTLPDDPVFILGLWRSGTTVLHELINACGGWVTPQTWQCFNPSTCFLTGPPRTAASVTRPMDEGRIATFSPQEEEFATLLLGEPSVYRGLIDPRRLVECGERLWSSNEGPMSRWQDFLRGVSSAGAGRLLLKSPSHTFRLPLIRQAFPRALFVWIGRHPGEVLASNHRMWQAMMSAYGLWECPAGELERFLRQAVRACSAVLESSLAEMPPDRMLWVDYDGLQADPVSVLRQILRFVRAPAASDPVMLQSTVQSAVAAVTIHAGKRAELPKDDSLVALDRLMRAVRDSLGAGYRD
ncbi:MAG: sulfotransferase family protein [Steroidobacteraceae bacterium]